jgi:D-serine deaminase-like pyridoxal phosphate-dependent protein
MTLYEIETPALCVDLDTLEKNLQRMGHYVKDHGLKLRPHTKTHKIPEIAAMQIAAGAYGLTVAKSSEAAVMAAAQMPNLLIAYPVYGRHKWIRLAEIAAGGTEITVAIDDATTLSGLSSAAAEKNVLINILVEVDVGMHRCGFQSSTSVLDLARKAADSPGIHFAGLNLYPGHIWATGEEQGRELMEVSAVVEEVTGALAGAGLSCQVVSGGSTPTAFQSHLVRALTEIRPGTYVFNDRNTLDAKACQLSDCALEVVVTTVSRAIPGYVVVDGGSKTFSSDRLLSGAQSGFGLVSAAPSLVLERLSEEHGQIRVPEGERRPEIGDKLRLIPNHVCAAVNLHNRLWYHRKGEILGSWNIAGRGCVW